MSNVIEFKRERWCAGPVECFQCKHEWVGVWPEGLLHLYCPECDGPYGLPLDEQTPAEPEADHERNIAFDDEVCPVCGYYCNGKGGFGCIDKPVLTGLRKPPKPAEPARKPMTEAEIDSGFRYGDVGYMNGFLRASATQKNTTI